MHQKLITHQVDGGHGSISDKILRPCRKGKTRDLVLQNFQLQYLFVIYGSIHFQYNTMGEPFNDCRPCVM